MPLRTWIPCAFLAALLGLAPLSAWAGPAEDAVSLPDHALGSPNAPVTILEYASLTCPHCAEFQTKILDRLKTNYIDTGKVRLIFRDFPLDGVSLRVAAVARCMPADNYNAFISVLFKNQLQWRQGDADAAVKAAIRYAKLGGLSEADALACSTNEKLLDAIVARRMQSSKDYDIQATPTFIFNEGVEKFAGAMPYEQFAKTIDGLLNKTK